VADIDPTLVKKILDVPNREREAYAKHRREANDLWSGFEGAEWRALAHPKKLSALSAEPQPSSSDSSRSRYRRIGRSAHSEVAKLHVADMTYLGVGAFGVFRFARIGKLIFRGCL
jgi:hypothetical protein